MKENRIPFDIKYRQDIEAGRYRVETRDGRPARIVCWDAKCKNYPVIAEIDGKVDDECTMVIQYKKDGVSNTHYDFFLFLVPVEQEAYTITCWVARDKDGGLFAFEEKPERLGTYWGRMPCSVFVSLPSDAFPSLCWRNKPIEVTLTIKRKEESK